MTKQASIENILEQCIRQGRWQIGERLPSERALAQEFGISRGTLRSVMQSFVGQGILEIRAGSGMYLCSLPKMKRRAPSEVTNRNSLKSFAILMTALVKHGIHECSIKQIGTLEACLQEIGIAVLTCDLALFVEGQRSFFQALLVHFANSHMSELVLQTLPPNKVMVHLLAQQDSSILNQFFVLMAQMLTAYRRMDSLEAERVIQAYTDNLFTLIDENEHATNETL